MAYQDVIAAEATLVGYWPLTDPAADTSLDDASPTGKDIPAGGAYALGVPGLLANDVDTACEVTGVVDMDINTTVVGNETYFQSAGPFALEAVIKPAAGSFGGTTGRAIVHDWANQIRVYLRADGRLETYMRDATVGYLATAPTALVAGTIYHVAATWDGSTLRLYQDGAEVATRAFAGTATEHKGVTIADAGGIFDPLIGVIAHAAIYNGLGADRVLAHYDAARVVQTTGPGGMLIDPVDLAALPTSGSAWTYLLTQADDAVGVVLDAGSSDSPWLANYNNTGNPRLATKCLAAALVYARAGGETYRATVEAWLRHIMGSEEEPATDGTAVADRTLAVMRQLPAFIVAADLIGHDGSLTGTRSGWTATSWDTWLATLLHKQIDTLGISQVIYDTHETFANNQALYAFAARVALAIYQDDTVDLANAVDVFKRFLGDTGAHVQFTKTDDWDASYVCLPAGASDPDTEWVAVNPADCGPGKDGLIVEDIARSAVSYPDYDTVGRTYLLEAYQPALLGAVLLSRTVAYADVWDWSDQALKRIGDWVDREGIWPGVDSSDGNQLERHIPWIPNYFYGTGYATASAQMGRGLGFTDWLYAESNGGGETVTPFVEDTFTDADGTDVLVHVGEAGATWTKLPSYGGGAAITGNRARNDGSPTLLYASGAPASPEYDIDCVVYIASVTQSGGVMARVDVGADTFYDVRVQSGSVRLQRAVAGATTLLGSYSITTVAGQSVVLKWKLRDGFQSVDVDGVVDALTSTDTAIPEAGRVGVRMIGSGASTGFHVDSVIATDVVPPATGGPDTPTGLTAAPAAGAVAVAWDANAAAVDGYRLSRDAVEIYDGPATTFADTGATVNTEHDYTLTAYDTGGESAPAGPVLGIYSTGWQGHGSTVGAWPGPDWQPYAAESPFNQPINPTVDVIHPDSAAMVADVLALSGNSALPVGNMLAGQPESEDYSHPYYFATADDPLFTLSAQYIGNADGDQIRIPDAARPAGASDGHMTVITPDGLEYDFWQVTSKPLGGGTLACQIVWKAPADGPGVGVGAENEEAGGATASKMALIAGLIRAQELEAQRIDHALFCIVMRGDTDLSFGYGVQADIDPNGGTYVYPSYSGDARAQAGEDLPPMGARLWLDMTAVEIDALAIPAWRKTILKAISEYGAYFGDTGGPGLGFFLESGTSFTSMGDPDPVVAFAQANGLPTYEGAYVFNLSDGVPWADRLRVVIPPGSASDLPPAASTGLTAAAGDQQVQLDWTSNIEPDLDVYVVERRVGTGGVWEQLATTVDSSHLDETAASGSTYYYRVRARDTALNVSDPSAEVTAAPLNLPPDPPTGLVATAGDQQVALDWTDNAEPDLDHYLLYRRLASDEDWQVIYVGPASAHLDTEVQNGSTYVYRVTAVDAGG